MSEMTYRQAGDYQIPNLQLENEGEKPLGKYGRLRRPYLKQHRPVLYLSLIHIFASSRSIRYNVIDEVSFPLWRYTWKRTKKQLLYTADCQKMTVQTAKA